MTSITLAIALAALSFDGGPIRLHPENARYFVFRGAPTFLITSGEHYGAVLNRDFDKVPYLDELKDRGFNLTRVFSGTYREIPGSFKIQANTLAPKRGRLASPWLQVQGPGEPEKFDLDRFDESYFRRLKEFVTEAGSRGIVVEYVLFCPLYGEDLWAANPMNASNNVNGVGECKSTEVLTLKHPDLLDRQLAFVRKVVSELNLFDNVYFEICNEPYFGGVTLDWQAKVAETIVEAEKPLTHKHMIAQNIANGKARVEEPNPAVSLFNFHYASPPDLVAMNSGLKAALGDDETGFQGTGDRFYRREAWEFLMAGGSLYNNLDYSFTVDHPDGSAEVKDPTPGGGGRAFRSQLSVLKRFFSGLDFLHMSPMPPLIAGSKLPEGARAYALGRPGEYAVYVGGGPRATLSLKLSPGHYRYEWIDSMTGDSLKSGIIEANGPVMLESPEYREEAALRISQESKLP
ncbi:hypothetical protein P12x_002347 [Tundrisphaera lichenicola]|uniref:hypothetical protein n=1 Tax=Tundrisphaera lichenicola TaxID=2029860 RepID=UPI003EC0C4E9